MGKMSVISYPETVLFEFPTASIDSTINLTTVVLIALIEPPKPTQQKRSLSYTRYPCCLAKTHLN